MASATSVVGAFLGLTISFAGAGAGAFAFAVAVAVMVVTALAILVLDTTAEQHPRQRDQLLCVALLGLILSVLLAANAYFVPQWMPNAKRLQVDRPVLILLLFFGILPLCNAVFDWLSVGFTRYCLRYMLAARAKAWALVVLDALVAILLTFGLFALVLWILLGLQAVGWGIDGRAMLSRFAANPLDSQSSWIALLALTNLLPTLWHLVLSLWGWLGSYSRPSSDAATLIIALDQSLDAQGRPVAGATGHLLGDSDRHAVYQTLYVEWWLVPLAIVGLVIAFWTQYVQSLGWLMRLVLAV